jgi:hypothetical protein
VGHRQRQIGSWRKGASAGQGRAGLILQAVTSTHRHMFTSSPNPRLAPVTTARGCESGDARLSIAFVGAQQLAADRGSQICTSIARLTARAAQQRRTECCTLLGTFRPHGGLLDPSSVQVSIFQSPSLCFRLPCLQTLSSAPYREHSGECGCLGMRLCYH